MKGRYAVVGFEDESFYSVMAVKIFEGSWNACVHFLYKRDREGSAAIRDCEIVDNFDGSEIKADYIQGYGFWE